MALSREARVIIAHEDAMRLVRERVNAYLGRYWNGLGSWRDDDIEKFIGVAVKAVESGQKQVSQLTNSYLDTLYRMAGVGPLPSAELETYAGMRGVDPEEVYRRPAAAVYAALSEGKPIEEAVKLGLQRMHYLASTDMQIARTRTFHNRIRQADGRTKYRRVLTGAENCALCVIASSHTYYKATLMPIHPGCDCSVAPVIADYDPGFDLAQQRYDEITARLDQAGLSDKHTGTFDNHVKDGNYRDLTKIQVREHGEYGPTLTWADQAFTGPADLA